MGFFSTSEMRLLAQTEDLVRYLLPHFPGERAALFLQDKQPSQERQKNTKGNSREHGTGLVICLGRSSAQSLISTSVILNCCSSFLEKRELRLCKESKFLKSSLGACSMYFMYNRNESC